MNQRVNLAKYISVSCLFMTLASYQAAKMTVIKAYKYKVCGMPKSSTECCTLLRSNVVNLVESTYRLDCIHDLARCHGAEP